MGIRNEMLEGMSDALDGLLDLILWLVGVILKAAVWTVKLMLLLAATVALGVGLYFLLCRYVDDGLALWGAFFGWLFLPVIYQLLMESWEAHEASKQ